MNIRILITLTPEVHPNAGGVQNSTFKLARYFHESGCTVAVFSFEREGHISVDSFTIYSAPHHGNAANPENVNELTHTLELFNPDVVINQMPYIQPMSACLAINKSRLNYTLIGCVRNSLFNFKSNARDQLKNLVNSRVFKTLDNPIGLGIVKARHWIRHRSALRTMLRRHDLVVLLTPPNIDELEHFVGRFNQHKIRIIPNSIPPVEVDMASKEKVILHVGRINIRQKRSDLLLDFWENVQNQNTDWTFVIVGDGPYFASLEDELKRRNLRNVQLEGYQKPDHYYKKASIFMMPSAFEGFPNTIIEAQSNGCAPLAFNSYAALSWIVNDRSDCYLSKPFDTAEMASQALALMRSPEKLKEVQIEAKRNSKRFEIGEIGEQWMRLFKVVSAEQ